MSSGGHGGGRRKKHVEHEEHVNHERWLVSYADMMTLLMVLFVVLFAISALNVGKFEQLKNGLSESFGAPAVLEGATGVLDDQSAASSPIELAAGTGAAGEATAADRKIGQSAVSASQRATAQVKMVAAQEEADTLAEAQRKLAAALKAQGLTGTARFSIDERGLVVTVVTSSVVFSGDSAVLRPAGQRIIAAFGPTLRELPNRIEVDGHTNQLPVPTVNYPSAWELSTARASAVVRFLIARDGVAAARMSAAGFAGEKPLYKPTDPRAATLNRRVEIIVLSGLDEDTRALLTSTVQADSLAAGGTATKGTSDGHN
jgi:chemotaxis protein MotB